MSEFSGKHRKTSDARVLRSLSSKPTSIRDSVDSKNTQDHFKLRVSQRSTLSVTLAELSANANLELLNRKGKRIARSERSRTKNESIQTTVDASTYYVRVSQQSGETSYALKLSSSKDPGDIISKAKKQRSPKFTSRDQVSAQDSSDVYRFNVKESGVFTAQLSDLTGDADVRLILDKNDNNRIDRNEVVAWQWERKKSPESIRKFVSEGQYFLEVRSYNKDSAKYRVKTDFKATKKDKRQFSIDINFSSELSQFNTMSNAMKQAAQFWENVITHTTFDRPHSLKIFVDSADLTGAIVEGKVKSGDLKKDRNGVFMPTAGRITYDIDHISQISANRRLAIHELGHVLGLVSLDSGFFDANTSTYKAKSYAGWAYGELLGTHKQTAVPMLGASHWDYNVIPNEVMNTFTGPPNGLVSQMTVAALRDIGWNVNYSAADTYSLDVIGSFGS